MRPPTVGELEMRRLNSADFNAKPQQAAAPRITFYFTQKTVVVGKGKDTTPTRETLACDAIADQLFSGKSSDCRIGVLAPFFAWSKVEVETITDKATLVLPPTITIDDAAGVQVARLQGNPTIPLLVEGMLKALAASRIAIDTAALAQAAQNIKRIGQLIDQQDAAKQRLAAFQVQLKTTKASGTISAIKAQEAQWTAKLAELTRELETVREALKVPPVGKTALASPGPVAVK